jgi:hypothetical protein
MAERGDQGFEVAPTRIGDSGGPKRSSGRRRAPIVLIVVLALAIPTIAWAGPRIEWRPEVDLSFLRPSPTPVPSPTPRPTLKPTRPPATPLPAITVGEGRHPTVPFAVDVNGMRLADPATGSLGPPFDIRGDLDSIFSEPDGTGWWCLCYRRTPGDNSETATVEMRRVSPSGQVTFRRQIGEYTSTAPTPSQDFYNRFDLVVSRDQRTAYLSSATRSGLEWSVAIEAIDLRTGNVTPRTDLGTVAIPPITGPTPPPDQGFTESYLSGPSVRMSPDGRRVLVWTSIEKYSPTGESQGSIADGWLIDVDAAAGAVGRVTPLAPSLANRLRACAWAAWTGPDELAAVCWPTDPNIIDVSLVVLTPDGTERGHVDIHDATNSWIADPILDRANRRVYLWQPNAHVLSRIDLDGLTVQGLQVDPAATGGGQPGSQGGSGSVPEWAPFTSDLHMYYGPSFIAEPGTGRLFGIGMLQQEGNERYSFTSTGVWVFDGPKLELLDHWAATAGYGSIGLSPDGRWLFAAGVSGSDEAGRQANWQSSLTVIDVTDGRPALQLGSLGADAQVFQIPP